jgi:1-acyl-sn-glycerol-3-phosphate acyltransferase
MEKLKKIWIKLVKLCGWKFNLPEKGSRPEVERCVFVVAPHTSAWDFIIGATYLWSCCSNGKIFIAKEFFFWPLGPFLRGLGAISIDRKSHKDYMVKAAVEEFKKNEQLSIVITPEGTRRAVERWKNGFLEIARRADVPIVLAYVDFKKKEMGLFDTIKPSSKDNREADMQKVRSYYRSDMAKYPEKFIEI